MSHIYSNIELGLDEDLEEKLKWLAPNYKNYRVLRKSVDARKYHQPHFVYSVEVFGPNEVIPEETFPQEKVSDTGEPVLIIGAGPAGLFAALRLAERGISCKLFEQGSSAQKRMIQIARFWRYGEFNPQSNVCFGEGGAGLYSDGKLITRIKSPHIPYVMQRLVQFGAPEEIKYLANPHVGSDRIRRVIPKMHEQLLSLGVQIFLDTKVTNINFENKNFVSIKTKNKKVHHGSKLILACGHSAEDLFKHLHQKQVFMEPQSFALGLRIEHPQSVINKIQYRNHYDHPKLGAANYKLSSHYKEENIGVYSFCMCPGGYVLSSGTSAKGLVSNGMSNYHRNSPYANAALVVTIDAQKNFEQKDVFSGLKFRTKMEALALKKVQEQQGTHQLPAQKLTDFLDNKISDLPKGSSPSGTRPVRLDQFLPETIYEYLRKTIEKFDQNMKGFIDKEALLYGLESRTSCPLRITRDKMSLESLSHKGLYPTGEGAGYAGGITSAACDGIQVAEKVIEAL